MKKIACAFLFLALTGCAHYYYAPNAANIPALKQKNDFVFKGGYSGDFYSGADIQVAYAAGQHFGVMLNSFFAGESDNVSDNFMSSGTHKESGTGSYVEAAGGYFKPFGHQKVWIFETYAGAGIGGEKHVFDNFQNSRLGLTKVFIQPSLAYCSKNEHFEARISCRLATVKLKLNSSKLSTATAQADQTELNNMYEQPSSVMWEPSLFFAGGCKWLKLSLQRTISKKLNNE